MEAITGYIEKLGFHQWLHDNHGIDISGLDGIQYAEGGTAVETEAFLAAYDELPAWKAQKRDEIEAEGLTRINSIYPAVQTLDDIKLIADLVKYMLDNGAAAPTGDLGNAAAIYSAARSAIIAVNALINVASVQAYDAVTAPAWP